MVDGEPTPVPEGGGGTGMTIDEMETNLATIEKPKEEPKENESATAWKEALRISEEARKTAEAAARVPASATTTAPPAPPAPDRMELLSDDEIAKIIEEKGTVAGLRAVQQQTLRVMNRHADQRLGALSASGASVAENDARARYPLEFELFGDQIREVAKNAPDKTALGSPDGWDTLVAFVRGKSGNIEKYTDSIIKKRTDTAEITAREAQRAATGAHAPSAPTPTSGAITPGPDGHYGLDATERQIADVLGRNYKDYATYKRMG